MCVCTEKNSAITSHQKSAIPKFLIFLTFTEHIGYIKNKNKKKQTNKTKADDAKQKQSRSAV